MASPQATEAARNARRARIAELGAVTLPDAAAAVGVGVDSLGRWVKEGHSKTAFRGPKGTGGPWLFRLDDLRAELEAWRCSWPEGCTRYALLSTSGRCRHHDADVPRGGKIAATDFAEKHRISPPELLARIKSGEIPAQRVTRRGRPACWLLVEEAVLALLGEHFRCQWHEGCKRYALGPSRHCNDHAGAWAATARARSVTRVCTRCGRERHAYPSQARARTTALCLDCTLDDPAFSEAGRDKLQELRAKTITRLAADGLVPQQEIAAHFGIAPTSLASRLAEADIGHERRMGIVFLDMRAADAYRLERIRTDGRARAALNFEAVLGRLEAAEIVTTRKHEKALRERFKVKARWKQRLSPGRPAMIAARWLEIAQDVITHRQDHGLSLEPADVLEVVWHLDWDEHPGAWCRDRYPPEPDDSSFPARAGRRRAIDRLQKRVGDDVARLIAAVTT